MVTLPSEHALSLSLAATASKEKKLLHDVPAVKSFRVVSDGLVEVLIQAGSTTGFGARAWPLRIGGAGIGDEPSVAQCLGTQPCGPLAVRFDCGYLSLPGVDDAGNVDASFFSGMGETPSLQDICVRASEWLIGASFASASDEADDDERARREAEWHSAEVHTTGKQRCIDAYRLIAKSPKLVSEDACLRAEWLSPAFRGLLSLNSAEERSAHCVKLLQGSGGGGDGGGSDGGGGDGGGGERGSELSSVGGSSGNVLEAVGGAGSGIYSFELFTPALCALMLDEIDGFEATDLPRRRPNTMNRAGLIVNEIGMHSLLSSVLEMVVAPLSHALYASEAFASSLDHHHSFVVQYSTADGGDSGLDMHHDAAEVTLNVCLGREFAGAGLRFCGEFGSSEHRRTKAVHAHVPGRAVIHLGRQRHGADDISSGERLNLIMWARSSAFRGAAAYGHVPPDGYPQESETQAPDRLCLSKSNDRDYERKLVELGEAPEPSHMPSLAAATGGANAAALAAFAGAMPAAKCARISKK